MTAKFQLRDGLKKWKFKMAFAVKCRITPLPLTGTKFHPFSPHLFSFAIESYIYETDFTLGLSQKYHFKSSYKWFKIHILRLLQLLTANYFAMFKVTSTTIYT